MIQYGQTTNFIISYDSSLTGMGGNPNGPALSQGVLDYCEYDLVRLSMLFGNIMPPASSLPFLVNLVPGAGGAWNNGTNLITCNINTNSAVDGMPALVVAEEAEIFMNIQAKGWNPGWSNGEALSRVCAQILYPERSWLFSTGSQWLNNNPRPGWVDTVEHTDQDFISIGCGSIFLNYLAYQLNYSWPDIIGAGAPTTNTLSETATILGVQNAYSSFASLLAAYYPVGTTVRLYTDDVFPLGAISPQVPILYVRHNLADNGTSHVPPLSSSPDIILKNDAVANPQATYSTPGSIGSDTESDPDVVGGQANYVYLRVWNRGADAANVFATVYWSPVATLVTPDMWNLIGSAYYPDVPLGSTVQVSNPGITWPSDEIPAPGHYCFVATVGNADNPAPGQSAPSETGPPLVGFANFNDYENYVAANNNIAWRNFNVVTVGPHMIGRPPFGEFIPLPFLISGAWDESRIFTLETIAELPSGSKMALQVAEWIGRRLVVEANVAIYGDAATDPKNPRRARIVLESSRSHRLGDVELPRKTAAPSHLLVNIPAEKHTQPFDVAIRQLYGGREVGRITWRLVPEHMTRAP
jgi:hypothetical protein